MKVLLLSTFDAKGGAAIAASRLHQSLRQQGVDSTMMVREKFSDDPTIMGPGSKLQQGWAKTRGVIDALPMQFYRQRQRHVTFFPQWLPSQLERQIKRLAPDIINLHWVSGGFIPIELLARLRQPLVWTLHDMWPLTGGCHYSQGCDRFKSTCGACPQLGSSQRLDLSRWVWHRKMRSWRGLPWQLIAPSRWLAMMAKASGLFQDAPVTVVANGLDLTRYRPIQQQVARDILRLPQDCQLILFGAANATTDERKGFHFLSPILTHLKTLMPERPIELAIFGASEPTSPPELPFNTHYLGTLRDVTSLILAYGAADIFVLPSKQDNLPNTVMEALACGVPCVGFNQGGLPDMVQHLQTGFLAMPYNTQELAEGIQWVLEDSDRYPSLAANARAFATQHFDQTQQTRRYQSLFRDLL